VEAEARGGGEVEEVCGSKLEYWDFFSLYG